eukprot:m.152124 g.152124  ORF g.152124 m.152124 type:complete len:648 (+) comp30793_c2_seq1:211-2154(+)
MKQKKGKKTRAARTRNAPAHFAEPQSTTSTTTTTTPPTTIENDTENLGNNDTFEGTIQSLTQEMTGTNDPSNLEIICSKITIMLTDPPNVPIGLRVGVDSKFISLLIAPNSTTGLKVEAVGGLRNLLIGSDKTAERLLDGNIMGAISATLPKAVSKVAQRSPSDKVTNETEMGYQLVEQLVRLLWDLAEVSEVAMVVLNSGAIGPALITCLCSDNVQPKLLLVTAQCLQAITEDNPILARMILGSPTTLAKVGTLLNFTNGMAGFNAAVQAAVCGIVYNVTSSSPTDELEKVKETLPVMEKILSADTAGGMLTVGSTMATLRKNVNSPAMSQFNDFKVGLKAQQNVLEILANMCFADISGANEWEEMNDEEEMDQDDDVVEQASGRSVPQSPLVALIVQSGLALAVVARCKPLEVAMQQVFMGNATFGAKVLSEFTTVQSRCFGCLSNMFGSMDFGLLGADVVAMTWTGLMELCARPPLGTDDEFAEALTGCVWALLRAATDKTSTLQITTVSPQHVKALVVGAKAYPSNEELRVNIVGALGCLGQVALTQPETMHAVGVLLLQALEEPSGWVIAEALNGIFDVFDEPECNAVYTSLQMHAKLTATTNGLKQHIKEARRRGDADLTGRLSEAKLNLTRFIKYKAAQF